MFHIANRIRAFASDERGTATTEAIIVLPMLIWSMVAISIFFDAFRARSTNLKAAYTISDMVSREKPFIGPNYIGGLNTVYDFLAASPNPTWIRVTMIQFDTEDPMVDTDGRYILKWSHGTQGKPDLNDAALESIKNHIPIMGNGDSLIIVETHMSYEPFAEVGLEPYDLSNFITTRPRDTPPIWSDFH